MRVFHTFLIFATIFVLVGCISNVEKRRLSTLDRLHYSTSGDSERRQMAISNAVSQATVTSLRTPHIVEAVFFSEHSAKTNGAIWLYWLCVAPIGDGVRVQVQDGGVIDVPIAQSYQIENSKNAKDMVLFDAAVHQGEMSSIWPRLVSLGGRITLLAGGKPVSDTFMLRDATK